MRKILLKKAGSFAERLAADLNEAQAAAATAPDGFNLILAGPGSGKTRVVTYRVAHLIEQGVSPESILLVTFTRRAAQDMVRRLGTLVGAGGTRIWAGTFHHIGNRILRKAAKSIGLEPNFTILDSEDQRDLIGLALVDAGLSGTGRYAPKAADLQKLFGLAFNSRRDVGDLAEERYPDFRREIETAARIYEARKRAANSLDYDDLLGCWSRLLREHPNHLRQQAETFRHILVDEMQDTNRIQIELVETIARAGANNLTAVGDDAQSIYRFRGAYYQNLVDFPRRNPETRVFRLELNYRSTPEIVAFVNASIAHNASGFAKNLVSARTSGIPPAVVAASDGYEEAEFICEQILDWREQGIALDRIAVLCRNNHDGILLEAELTARGIPYHVRGGLRFFEQAHIKDVLAYLRIFANPRDEPAWRRLLLLLPGIGPAKAAAIWQRLALSADPFESLATAETMTLAPSKSKGFLAGFVTDLRAIAATDPQTHPGAAVDAVLRGGYSGVLRDKYSRPEERLSDIQQLGVLALQYDMLDSFVSELILAGDLHSAASMDAEPAGESLVLSTIHQAKGLEWSRVVIPRLIDESFPNRRALFEADGEEEERRIFYVGVSRAMDELILTYPVVLEMGGRGPAVWTVPSRFLTEIENRFYEKTATERRL